MIHRLSFALMIGLAIWVISVGAVIEWKNSVAGYYLPRRDAEAGSKWRVSYGDYTPNDQLRQLVESVGLLQYPVCLILGALAVFHFNKRENQSRRILSAIAAACSFLALCIAFYRGYFSSLGW